MAVGLPNRALSEEEKKREQSNAPRLGMVPNTAATTPASGDANAPKLGMVASAAADTPASSNVSDKTIADEYENKADAGSVWRGNPNNKSFGLSVVPTADKAPATIAPSNGGRGFGMPNAPTRGWGERQERESLLRDASTAYKGSQNGQLTAKQMELRAGIIGADDKYKNDQYTTQVNAASQLAQSQMAQDGANQRDVLGESGSDSRLDKQLGFDAEKLKSDAAMSQQKLGFDAQKAQATLDVNRYNADTARMKAETGQEALERKGQLTEVQRNDRIGHYKLKANSLDGALELADGMIANTDGLAGNTGGLWSTYVMNVNDTSKKFNSDRKALLSQAFLSNADLLSGVLTDMDAKELKNAFGNLQDTTISEEDYANNLVKARDLMQKIRDITDERYQDVIPYMDNGGGNAAASDKNNEQGDIEFNQ